MKSDKFSKMLVPEDSIHQNNIYYYGCQLSDHIVFAETKDGSQIPEKLHLVWIYMQRTLEWVLRRGINFSSLMHNQSKGSDHFLQGWNIIKSLECNIWEIPRCDDIWPNSIGMFFYWVAKTATLTQIWYKSLKAQQVLCH